MWLIKSRGHLFASRRVCIEEAHATRINWRGLARTGTHPYSPERLLDAFDRHEVFVEGLTHRMPEPKPRGRTHLREVRLLAAVQITL